MKYGQVHRYWNRVAVSIGNGGETRYLDVHNAEALVYALQEVIKDIKKYPNFGKSRCGTSTFQTGALNE